MKLCVNNRGSVTLETGASYVYISDKSSPNVTWQMRLDINGLTHEILREIE
jgi:hypothetical protein